MSKRKPLDKAEARERRNRMLHDAAAARLSLTEGVREMRAIAGMTQEEFARHRGVSARVIKAIELGQGNPTVETLNRIGQFFGLEVAFVPIRRESSTAVDNNDAGYSELVLETIKARKEFADLIRIATEKAAEYDAQLKTLVQLHTALNTMPADAAASKAPGRAKRKPRAT